MLKLIDVCKSFQSIDGTVDAVKNVSLHIEKGDVFGIIGLSGAGKSTLVRCLNLLERPTSGTVLFKGEDLTALSKKELLRRRRSISMIFQGFNLLEQRTALKNVCFPLEIAGVSKSEAKKKAEELLEIVGLSDRLNSYPSQLSGGQKQRVAIARALASDPEVLLCDEATSALDPNTTRSILSLLSDINKKMGVTIVVITHEMKVVEQICNKVAVLDGGNMVECGTVSDVFISPHSDMARDLIFPRSRSNHTEDTESANARFTEMFANSRVIRLVFEGQSSYEPVISNLAMECGASVNIIGADTKNLDGKAYGQMLLQLPSNEDAQSRILKYFADRGIKCEDTTLSEDNA